MSTTPTCKTCGGTAGRHVPSVLDPKGIGDPGHKVDVIESGVVFEATPSPKLCNKNYKIGIHTVRIKDGIAYCPRCGFPVKEHK